MKKKTTLAKSTTDRRTYKIVKKRMLGICWFCSCHPSFWRVHCEQDFKPLVYEEDGTVKPEKLKFKDYPSWKLVNKNRRQWMKKRFIQRRVNYANGTFDIFYGW